MKEQSLVISGKKERVRDRSLVVYFILAYAISWAFMLPVALSAQGIIPQKVPYALYYLASFGPALSAMIVTAATVGRAGLWNLLSRLWKQSRCKWGFAASRLARTNLPQGWFAHGWRYGQISR